MAGNFFLSTFMSLSLNFLWGMVNCLQVIVYLPLLNIVFPANVNMLMTVLISVAIFDVVPMIDDIQEWLFGFQYTTRDEIDHQGYQQLDFETHNFIMNTGSLYFISMFYLSFRLFVFLLHKIAYYNPEYVWLYRKLRTDASI